MFKKSVYVLLFCVIITSMLILGYVGSGRRGPGDELRDAQAQLAQGQYAEVIANLSQALMSPTFQKSVHLQVQVWRLRSQAYAGLGNATGALQDVRDLLINGFEDDIDLRLDEVRYLATDGQGELARRKAIDFLADHPDHPRGLELAGEACQTAYQPMMRALRDSMDRELGASSRELASQTLLTFLFRPAADPLVNRAGRRLEELFSVDPRLQQLWPQFWADAKLLQERVREGLGYFQKSLDLGAEPVAAFRAIATSLEQSGRIDDLLVACEIQRRMFDHVYVAESGALASWVRLQAGLPEAALATTNRWLPDDQIEDRASNQLLSTTTDQIILARALAAWRKGDIKEIRKTLNAINALRKVDRPVIIALHLALAARRILQGNKELTQIESSLQRVIAAAVREPAPHGRPDFVAELAPLWIDALISDNATESAITEALDRWRRGRPEAIEPLLRTAEYQLSRGSTAAALAAIDEAAAHDPEHPAVFPLHLNIARVHHENSAQDGPSLLAACVRNRKALPDAREPIGFVLCAEAALDMHEKRVARIALACARNAIGSFPRANIPRQLELRALIEQEDYEEAARTAQLTIRAIKPNATTLAIAIEAMQLAGRPVREMLRLALPLIAKTDTESGRKMQVELLRTALADAPSTSDLFISEALLAKETTVEHRVLAIHAYVHSGKLPKAAAQLRAAQPSEDPLEQELLSGALATFLSAKAETTPDANLLKQLQNHRRRLQLDRGPQHAMLAAATQLAEEHPHTAFDLLNTALPAALAEERTGALYVLAGDLALQHRDPLRAKSYWMAAMGFADGAHIAERLSRLLLVLDEETTARRIFLLTAAPTDPALAARFGHATIAANLLGQTLQLEPADLLTHAALSIFGPAPLLDWQPPTDLEVRDQRLLLLTSLRDPRLGWLCVPLAEEILRQNPKAKTSSLLLARAAADAGQPLAAGVLHAELFKAGYNNLVLWREAAYAGQNPAYATSPELTKQIMGASLGKVEGNSKLAHDYGGKLIIKGFEAGGFPDMAKQARLMQWKTRPHMEPCTAEDLELITTGHTPLTACTILDKVLNGPHPCDRDAVRGAFYQLAEQLIQADRKHGQLLAVLASRYIATDGALGQTVHFLLDNPVKALQLNTTQLLRDHLEMIATGRDDQTRLQATLTALIARTNTASTSEYIDTLLERYPTSVPLWSVRASLTYRQDRDPRGLAELRTVLTHADDPEASLRFVGLVTAARVLQPADLKLWQQLPKALKESPQGAYVQGMIALRQGKPDEAIEFLQKAAPQHDGRHLFDRALAYLESADPDGTTKAKTLLQQLLADYPKSSLAQNAGSFVRQLAERP